MGRRWIAAACAALTLAAASALAAQPVVSSPGPDAVAVTVYRDPERGTERAPDLSWLDGYALVSERRRIRLPAGEATVRFEGVAGGILPQSAIVTGFPEGIVERNRDAYLLSPATLLDRSLGRRVHLRRTSLATGAVREQEAVIRSGSAGAVVIETAEGIEALRCTGLAETLVYDEVPPGLSASPTLSVRTRSAAAVEAEVTLSYLASGFDWQADYILHLAPDGRRADLFAWLTLASTDETSFRDADALAVAGTVRREQAPRQPREGGPLRLQCWPEGRTSDPVFDGLAPPPPPPPPPPPAPGEAIIVTGSRIAAERVSAAVVAEQEDLGDLKLYRIPEPVTIAARSQKQVALLSRPGVRVALVHRLRLDPAAAVEAVAARRVLVTRNREREGLGVPLPAGGVLLFAEAGGRPILLGSGHVRDRAVGDDVEIELGEATGIVASVELVRRGAGASDYRLVVANDGPRPVAFEAEFDGDPARFRPARRLSRRDGRPLWTATVPANGTAELRYRVGESR